MAASGSTSQSPETQASGGSDRSAQHNPSPDLPDGRRAATNRPPENQSACPALAMAAAVAAVSPPVQKNFSPSSLPPNPGTPTLDFAYPMPGNNVLPIARWLKTRESLCI